ncbi:hypothetical protein OSTOST_04670 [Ostertagia ostertagi]
MSFQSGVTRTGYALRRAEDELFNGRQRGEVVESLLLAEESVETLSEPFAALNSSILRRNASKIVALFTDGLSIDDPLKPSEHLRLQRGVKIYVVSVSADGFGPEMQRIAGESANVYGLRGETLITESHVHGKSCFFSEH